jgi:hypothetical protein
MTNAYSFHDMIRIKIDDNESDLALYYDHYFRHLASNEVTGDIHYQVLDYRRFSLPTNHIIIGGLACGFDYGICCPEERYAVTWDGKCLTEYTDTANRATNLWLQLLLGTKGMSLVHGAGLALQGKGIIFPGFGGAGKTMLIAALRNDPDFLFFGDDFVAVDAKGKMFAYPSDLSIYNQHLELFPQLCGTVYGNYFSDRNQRSALWKEWYKLPGQPFLRWMAMKLRKTTDPRNLGPLFSPLPAWNLDYVKVPAVEVLPVNQIGTNISLNTCLLLSRYSGSDLRIEKLSLPRLLQRIIGILDVEFRYGQGYLNLLAAFGVLDKQKFEQLGYDTLNECFTGIDLYEVLIPSNMLPSDYTEKMENLVREMIV